MKLFDTSSLQLNVKVNWNKLWPVGPLDLKAYSNFIYLGITDIQVCFTFLIVIDTTIIIIIIIIAG